MSERIDERARVRRSDRAMDDEAAIESFLQQGRVGFLATAQDNQPYVVPNLYWYDANSARIYLHTAREGRTLDNIRANPKVCMSVGDLGRLIPAETAMEFSAEYASVCVFGSARVAKSAAEQRRGLQGLLDKYFPALKAGDDYRPIQDSELERTAIFAIEIETWSGKRRREGS